jgi:uncharacterized protein YacL
MVIVKKLYVESIALLIIRFIFVLVAAGLGVQFISNEAFRDKPVWLLWLIFVGVMLAALTAITVDLLCKKKRLDIITAVYFGLIIGLFLTYVLRLALVSVLPQQMALVQAIGLILGMCICYGCISILMQTKDDFRFIIPYVEFSRDLKGAKPYILDTSVVIDGRIADVIDTDILDSQLIMPRFVINELQAIADSSDKLRRMRGRRGLDILNALRNDPDIDLQIYDHENSDLASHPVDIKLVLLAKELDGKVITNDYNLNKVAKLYGVGVVNLNDIANALKPIFLPGETIGVQVVKPGEEAGQGIAYLEDGTMIVIEGGHEHLNKNIRITVTSVLQTSAGRMVFGKVA